MQVVVQRRLSASDWLFQALPAPARAQQQQQQDVLPPVSSLRSSPVPGLSNEPDIASTPALAQPAQKQDLAVQRVEKEEGGGSDITTAPDPTLMLLQELNVLNSPAAPETIGSESPGTVDPSDASVLQSWLASAQVCSGLARLTHASWSCTS